MMYGSFVTETENKKRNSRDAKGFYKMYSSFDTELYKYALVIP
jgi:hypothetical protein